MRGRRRGGVATAGEAPPGPRSDSSPGTPVAAETPIATGTRELLRLAAAAGAVVMAATSTGDVLALGVVLGLVAADVLVGATAVLAGLATLARWSSSSLGAVAGGQAVVGAAGWTGPWSSVLSSWAAAAAIVLVCPRGRPAVLAFGLLAAGLVAGPALGGGSVSHVVLRLVASVVGVAAAAYAARAVPRRLAVPVGLELAALAFLLPLAPQL